MFGAKVSSPKPQGDSFDSGQPLFKSPDEYKNLTEDERKELTQKMLGDHKSRNFAGVRANG